jgi:iron(III) transport system permease protein
VAEGTTAVDVPDAPRRGIVRPERPIFVVALLVVGYLTIVPLAYLCWRTFVVDGSLSLDYFREAYSAYGLGEMALNSLLYAAGSTVLAVGVGTWLAYLLVRTDVPWKPFLFAAALAPLAIPGVLYAIAWIFLASPKIGVLNEGPVNLDVFSPGGMIVVEGFHSAPLVFLLMVAAFRALDPALEESAVASGARPLTAFRRVTLPLVQPALWAAVLIVAVRALESFEAPALIGIPAGFWVFTSRIWRALGQYPAQLGEAGAYSLSLLALTALGVFLLSRLGRRQSAFSTVTGRGFRPRPIPLRGWRWPALGLVGVYFTVAVALPLLVLVYASTQPYYSVPSRDSLDRMTLSNYRYVFSEDDVTNALQNSVLLGVGSATLVVLAGAICSWLVLRTRLPGRSLLDQLAFLPIAVPGLVLGVALLFVYLRLPIGVYGTLWILLISYCTRYLPFGMRYASVSMTQIGKELEESAAVSGARSWQTFRRVLLPLVVPGLVAGWVYIFVVSIRELASSILLYSPGNEVLSVVIWEQYENGRFPELAALGVMMVAGLVVLVAIAHRLAGKAGLTGP